MSIVCRRLCAAHLSSANHLDARNSAVTVHCGLHNVARAEEAVRCERLLGRVGLAVVAGEHGGRAHEQLAARERQVGAAILLPVLQLHLHAVLPVAVVGQPAGLGDAVRVADRAPPAPHLVQPLQHRVGRRRAAGHHEAQALAEEASEALHYLILGVGALPHRLHVLRLKLVPDARCERHTGRLHQTHLLQHRVEVAAIARHATTAGKAPDVVPAVIDRFCPAKCQALKCA